MKIFTNIIKRDNICSKYKLKGGHNYVTTRTSKRDIRKQKTAWV